jgi:single-stranded-DNA-specific exonuclease
VISPEDVGKGSGRSIKGMNLVDALCYCEEHLVKYGGHELAAGLSVKRGELDAFRRKINEYAKANLTSEDMIPTMDADCEISFNDISLELARSLQILEPYGVSNPVPAFVMRDVTVQEILGVSENKHTKLVVGNGRRTLTCMYFSNPPSSLGIYVGDKIDLLFNVDINEWAGRENLQIIVRDLKISEGQRSTVDAEHDRFKEIWSGGKFSSDENIMPCRDDFVVIYKLMLASFRSGVDTLSHREIIAKLKSEYPRSQIGYIKLKIIMMVLKELNIMNIEDVSDEVYKFAVHYSTQKTMLDKSTLLRKLRSQMTR